MKNLIKEISEKYEKWNPMLRKQFLLAILGNHPEVLEDAEASHLCEKILKLEREGKGMTKPKEEKKELTKEELLEKNEELQKRVDEMYLKQPGAQSQALAPLQPVKMDIMPSYKELKEIAVEAATSKFFRDIQNSAQAMALVLAGKELGVGPMISLSKLYIVNGKIGVEAVIMGDKIKQSGRYDYRIKELNNEKCELLFFEYGKPVGNSVFTIKDAEKAGLTNKDVWKKYPRNMLLGRALSNGARWYCPDVLHGAYTYEEMELEVDGSGNLIRKGGQTDKPMQIEGEVIGDTSNKVTREDKVREMVGKYGKDNVQKAKDELKIEGKITDSKAVDDKTLEKLTKHLEKPPKEKLEKKEKPKEEPKPDRSEEIKVIVEKYSKDVVVRAKASLKIKESLKTCSDEKFEELKKHLEKPPVNEDDDI